jgi:TonB family protein
MAQGESGARAVEARVPPAYPELAMRVHLQGLVRLRVTITPSGAPGASEVLGGNPVLVKAAQDAVAHWKWTPGPKETREIVEVKFQAK